MKEKKNKKSPEEVYAAVIRSKTAKEKIRLADGLILYAKKVNPGYFKEQTDLWIQQLKAGERLMSL